MLEVPHTGDHNKNEITNFGNKPSKESLWGREVITFLAIPNLQFSSYFALHMGIPGSFCCAKNLTIACIYFSLIFIVGNYRSFATWPCFPGLLFLEPRLKTQPLFGTCYASGRGKTSRELAVFMVPLRTYIHTGMGHSAHIPPPKHVTWPSKGGE